MTFDKRNPRNFEKLLKHQWSKISKCRYNIEFKDGVPIFDLVISFYGRITNLKSILLYDIAITPPALVASVVSYLDVVCLKKQSAQIKDILKCNLVNIYGHVPLL